MALKAVLFDLDGVLVSTDDKHYLSWKQLTMEEGIEFSEAINHRLRGVPRMKSLDIVLEKATKNYSASEKQQLADRKQAYFLDLIENFNVQDLLPGVELLLKNLREAGILCAVCSGSRNAAFILDKMGISHWFSCIVDGNDVTEAKPSPAVFIEAAKRLGVKASECIVMEDAEVGVESAINGGMKVVGIGCAQRLHEADLVVENVIGLTIDQLKNLVK